MRDFVKKDRIVEDRRKFADVDWKLRKIMDMTIYTKRYFDHFCKLGLQAGELVSTYGLSGLTDQRLIFKHPIEK